MSQMSPVSRLGSWLLPHRPRRLLVAAIAIAAVSTGVLVASAREPAPPSITVTVGTGPTSEQRLLATILVELLEGADLPAEVREFASGADARQALELGDVDVVPSYTGAVWLEELHWADPHGDPAVSYARVRREDDRRGLVWLPATSANATFAFVRLPVPATSARLGSLADLAAQLNTQPDERLCVEQTYAERPDGLAQLARLYAFNNEVLRTQILAASPEEAVVAVARGECLAGLTTATDGRARAFSLERLQDGLAAFPAMVVGAVVTDDLAERQPEAIAALAPFGPALTTELLAAWNAQVLLDPDRLGQVAERAAEQLRTAASPPPASG